jgi:uncharacterized protein
MILKILLLIGVIAAVYFLFFKKSKPIAASGGEKKKNEDEETMVPCHKCGTYVATKEAFIKEGKYYCSEACMHDS